MKILGLRTAERGEHYRPGRIRSRRDTLPQAVPGGFSGVTMPHRVHIMHEVIMTIRSLLLPAFAATFFALAAHAEPAVRVDDAWARATAPGQQVAGAFMDLTSARGAKLVGARSPAAEHTEIHLMRMVGDRMEMRALESLDLPAGEKVSLKPGGYHIMLINLAQPLKPGMTVPITLEIKDAQGKTDKLEVRAEVRETRR
jgi:copper(I)-binding protein